KMRMDAPRSVVTSAGTGRTSALTHNAVNQTVATRKGGRGTGSSLIRCVRGALYDIGVRGGARGTLASRHHIISRRKALCTNNARGAPKRKADHGLHGSHGYGLPSHVLVERDRRNPCNPWLKGRTRPLEGAAPSAPGAGGLVKSQQAILDRRSAA